MKKILLFYVLIYSYTVSAALNVLDPKSLLKAFDSQLSYEEAFQCGDKVEMGIPGRRSASQEVIDCVPGRARIQVKNSKSKDFMVVNKNEFEQVFKGNIVRWTLGSVLKSEGLLSANPEDPVWVEILSSEASSYRYRDGSYAATEVFTGRICMENSLASADLQNCPVGINLHVSYQGPGISRVVQVDILEASAISVSSQVLAYARRASSSKK